MSETAEQRRVRLAVTHLCEQSIARMEEMLRLHLLLPEERYVPGGIAIGPHYVETSQVHVRSLERVLSFVLGLWRRLQEGPVPDRWHGNDLEGGGMLSLGDFAPVVRDLYRFFFHYVAHLSRDLTPGEDQHLAVVGGGWTNRAHLSGIHVWVPDPARPESVLRLDPTLHPRGPTIDLWRDEQRRLFYLSHGHRQYVVDNEGQFPAH